MSKAEYLTEYSVVVTRLNAVETWSHQFVSLYFVFLAAIMTGVGFSYLKIDTLNLQIVEIIDLPLGNLIIGVLTSLGFFLTIWAILMLVHYNKRVGPLILQLARIEDGFRGIPNNASCFANAMMETKKGPIVLLTTLSVIFVMLIFLLGWLSFFLVLLL